MGRHSILVSKSSTITVAITTARAFAATIATTIAVSTAALATTAAASAACGSLVVRLLHVSFLFVLALDSARTRGWRRLGSHIGRSIASSG